MKRRAFIVFDQITPAGRTVGHAHIDAAAIESYVTALGSHSGSIVRTHSGGTFHVEQTVEQIAETVRDAGELLRTVADVPLSEASLDALRKHAPPEWQQLDALRKHAPPEWQQLDDVALAARYGINITNGGTP